MSRTRVHGTTAAAAARGRRLADARSQTLRKPMSWLPQGQLLPERSWRRRHRGVVVLLWLHAVALALFAVAHVYQGWRHMLMTLLPGYALTALYLSTGSLLLPVLVHVLIDVCGLVLTPAPATAARPVAQNG